MLSNSERAPVRRLIVVSTTYTIDILYMSILYIDSIYILYTIYIVLLIYYIYYIYVNTISVCMCVCVCVCVGVCVWCVRIITSWIIYMVDTEGFHLSCGEATPLDNPDMWFLIIIFFFKFPFWITMRYTLPQAPLHSKKFLCVIGRCSFVVSFLALMNRSKMESLINTN